MPQRRDASAKIFSIGDYHRSSSSVCLTKEIYHLEAQSSSVIRWPVTYGWSLVIVNGNARRKCTWTWCRFTVWKCYDFSVAQTLRGINFWGSRSSEMPLLPFLELWIWLFWFWYSLRKVQIFIKIKIQRLPMWKMTDFGTLDSSTLISRKIWVIEKFCNFYTVRSVTLSRCAFGETQNEPWRIGR